MEQAFEPRPSEQQISTDPLICGTATNEIHLKRLERLDIGKTSALSNQKISK